MRKCVVCDSDMHEGFLNESDGSTYCSEDCLRTVMSEQEYQQAYEQDWMFWTSWED